MSKAVIQITGIVTLIGLIMGSFINCWAWRYVHGESIVHGRSHCTSCDHDLGVLDLIPILSWIASRGKCRYCGAKVSARYPLTELICAVTFAAIAAVYGYSLETLELLVFAGILLFLSLTDLDERIIPNGCIITATVVRVAYLAITFALGQASPSQIIYYVLSALGMGVALIVIVLIADKAFGRESMGWGDIKLYVVAGFYFGWQQGLLLIILSCFIGILVSFLTPKTDDDPEEGVLKRTIPFGPSIAAACVIVMLVGNPIMSWYIGMLS